ncbi:glycoside hydrolase [Salinimonas iocasae]|uniref:Glycoside hydrolase n=2 Tax=Salinimonas iocasae TaxID=2572577 RepID=A0A5B7YE39_9ALTE|nr:glycoside hydrolase [Salinimonas iocasae]
MNFLSSDALLTHWHKSASIRLSAIAVAGLFSSFASADWQPVEGGAVAQGKPVYVRGSGFYTDNRINLQDSAVSQDTLRLVITNSSHPVENADGMTDSGAPYFDVNSISQAIRVRFAMQRSRLAYNAEVQQFSQQGRPDPTVNGPISFDNASVHDPSVIRLDNGEYYVFGSHLAAAKSEDLMNWYSVAGDGVENSPFFDTYEEEAAEGIAWSGGTVGSWAADVIQLEDGRYYFYYNHCASVDSDLCDASRSYLGVAVSDNIEGPYENKGLFLRSGHIGDENPAINGETYNGNYHPNAIDPDVFYGKNGRLWMVYGSYSGGIFVLEMSPQTGKPLEGQGFGTKIMGGFYSAIEGPYMFYSPESDYYYLFTSFGGYEQNDGYNMRISRSRSPTGPFVDAQGQDMLGASGNWSSIEPYGVKLMGGHVFDVNPGEPGSDNGYMAPGHNSAFYDEETGNHYVIFHTRFPDRGEGHEIRVHEMFINDDDWLVASPHRYVPIDGENIVDRHDLTGTYRFVNHEKDINREAKVSRYLQLNTDGSIGGDFTGSYRLRGDNRLTLWIDEVGTFEGVAAWQFNDNIQQLVPTFTALAVTGESVWGTQIPGMTVEEAVQATADALSVPALASNDIVLPDTGALGATINWRSDNESVVSSDGRVVRPAPGSSDTTVTITATITLNGKTLTRTFTVEVPARQLYNRVAFYQFENDLTDSLEIQPEGRPVTGTPDNLQGDVSYTAGQHDQGLWLQNGNGVRLPDGLIDNNAYTVSMWLNPSQLSQFTPAFFGASAVDNWISLVPWSWDGNTMLWRGSVAWYDASAGFRIPVDTWSHVAFSVDNGAIRLYIDGEQVYSGTGFNDVFSGTDGVFTLGVNYWDTPYQGLIDELAVYDDALTQTEIVALDIEKQSGSQLLEQAANALDLGYINAIKSDLMLPATGLFASSISWTSSNPEVISAQGKVTRPGETESDATVVLTATISLEGKEVTREFAVTVRSLGPVQPVAEFNFNALTLEDATGNFAAGIPTGAQLNTEGGAPAFTGGIDSMGLMLDGQSGVKLPDNIIQGDRYSVALWLNPTELTMFTSALFGYASADSWVSLVPRGHDGVSQNTMIWSGTQWYDAGLAEQIPVNTWSHIVYVVEQGEITVYLNGAQAYKGTGFPDVFSNQETTGLSIGVNFWDTPYNGIVDELKIYDDAISAQDVQALYSSSQAN